MEKLEKAARDCAQIFQRSSSCVEGGNAQLALRHQGIHRRSDRHLQALTVMHNYYVRKRDGTTASERFFEESEALVGKSWERYAMPIILAIDEKQDNLIANTWKGRARCKTLPLTGGWKMKEICLFVKMPTGWLLNGFLRCRCFLLCNPPFLFFKVAKKRCTHIRETRRLSAIPTFFFDFNLCGVLSRTWFICLC